MSRKNHKTSIGGQAILEGIVMKGPRKICTVVRKSDGELEIQEKPQKPLGERNIFFRIPIIRGTVNLVATLIEGMQAINYSAQFIDDFEEEPSKFEIWLEKHIGSEKMEKLIFGAALVLGMIIPILLFMLMPTVVAGLLSDMLPRVALNLIEGAIRIAAFLVFMYAVSKMKDIKRTFRYHGAEHKTIFCYEAGLPLTVENVRPQKRQHPRCGTSFLFVVMIISILVFSLVTWSGPLERMLLRIALLPVVIGISYEINRYVGRYDNVLTRILTAPGLALQNITVLEPDDAMIEVAIAAMERVIPENQEEDAW